MILAIVFIFRVFLSLDRLHIKVFKKGGGMALKIYPVFITLDGKSNGDFTTDTIKYDSNLTISDAKKIYKKLVKLSGLDKGEITVFNENCTVKCWYTFDGTKFLKKEY